MDNESKRNDLLIILLICGDFSPETLSWFCYSDDIQKMYYLHPPI